MEGHAIVADAALSPLSFMSYNISLNLSSILAKLPGSRFLTLLRKGGYETPIDTLLPTVASAVDELTTETLLDVDTPLVTTAIDKLVLTPGPWAFFASGYMLGLLAMTIVLHRMRNVIIPSRIPTRPTHHTFHPSPPFAPPLHYASISRQLWSAILPLNLSRTTTRLALHLPSIYFLCKMLLVWCLLVLQTCHLLPSFSDTQKSACWGILGYIERLVVWNNQKKMGDICWATFCSVCAALLVEGLMKALDGGSAFPIGNDSNTSPFNLVGYAFLLHAYSFPVAHSSKSTDESPSRPEKHAIITIAIPLLQLTIFHILSVSKRYSRHRLIPTALASSLSLAHFHSTLFLHFFSSSSTPTSTPTPTPTNPLSKLKSTAYLGGSKFAYPFLNYVPNIFETILIGTILLTISLNALVQLLVRGRVVRIFSGLGVIGSGANWQHGDESTRPGFFSQLPYEEDFSILLLRVGTASLEATSLRGWNNEVAPIALPVKSRNRNHTRGNKSPLQTYGVVRMGRIDVAEVQYGSSSISRRVPPSNPSNPYEDLSIRRRRRTKLSETQQRQQRGLFNEVRTIDLGITNMAEPASGVSGWWRQMKESWGFFVALWDVLTGLAFFLWHKAKSRGRSQPGKPSTTIRTSAERHQQPKDNQSVEDEDDSADDTEKEVYSRFLRGEEISDDEHDDDFTSSFEDEDLHRTDEEGEERDEEEENGQSEAVRLFSDFLRNGRGAPATSVGGEMVLAHLLHGQATSSGPLTRQGWRELVGQGGVGAYRSPFRNEEDDGDNIWGQPGPSFKRSETTPPMFNTTTCVICTNGQRDIICWPCRCLAMCDNCREALAPRSAPTKHCCPCCRQTVEGYSRIYIP